MQDHTTKRSGPLAARETSSPSWRIQDRPNSYTQPASQPVSTPPTPRVSLAATLAPNELEKETRNPTITPLHAELQFSESFQNSITALIQRTNPDSLSTKKKKSVAWAVPLAREAVYLPSPAPDLLVEIETGKRGGKRVREDQELARKRKWRRSCPYFSKGNAKRMRIQGDDSRPSPEVSEEVAEELVAEKDGCEEKMEGMKKIVTEPFPAYSDEISEELLMEMYEQEDWKRLEEMERMEMEMEMAKKREKAEARTDREDTTDGAGEEDLKEDTLHDVLQAFIFLIAVFLVAVAIVRHLDAL
ncbi:hypothetical protein BP5796_11813 [Coleophoma crateriformis]|uniref:Uncharacterized protein n=1 Tax=Coleophoma crateriformis TaxID=565419 RepID=A0A3D8QEP7_9HELO|nr:hypothetical protein BP5796_11813 [Coleophoma crateriformis]